MPEFRFEDEGEIGRGGMSVVRKGFDPLLERHTALKVLSAPPDDQSKRDRFLDEARITGQLEHPNIVPVYEYGTNPEGHDFINMKLVQGETLLQRIRDAGDQRLDPDFLAECLQILQRVCDAVGYAHSMGVVHRDLKPSNIMVGEFGQVYVMDWGIALRLDRERPPPPPVDQRTVLGTPTYIAPEQIDDPDNVDGRADVYCLGGILYALLTRRAPHQGRGAVERLIAATQGRIRQPETVEKDPRLPMALCRIAMRALARDPNDRYPTLRAMKSDIEKFLRGAWHLPSRRYAPGEAIVTEGEPGHEAFVIQSGRCQVHTEAQGDIRELISGDVFGELAILTHSPRSSTVRALSDVEVLVVTREVMTEGLGLNSWMGVFVTALARRFAELDALLKQQSGSGGP